MRPSPRHYYEITYDEDKRRYVKHPVHRGDCPVCKGLQVPKPRRARADGEVSLEVSASVVREEKAEQATPEVSTKESKEDHTWLTPARATIIAAIITGLFLMAGVWLTAELRDPDPAPAHDRPAQIEPAPSTMLPSPAQPGPQPAQAIPPA